MKLETATFDSVSVVRCEGTLDTNTSGVGIVGDSVYLAVDADAGSPGKLIRLTALP